MHMEFQMARNATAACGILGFGLGRVPKDSEEYKWWGDHPWTSPSDTLESDSNMCRVKLRGGGA